MAEKDLKVLSKDKGQLFVLFLLPLLLALCFGAPVFLTDAELPSGESRLAIKVYVVNQDEGPYGEQVEAVLRDIQPLRVLGARTVGVADEQVAEGEASAAIVIPADFSAGIDANQPVRIQLIKDPTHQEEARAVAGILNEVLTEFSVRAEVEYGIRAVYAKTGVLETADPELVRAMQAQTIGTIWTAVQEIRQNPAIVVQREDLEGETAENLSSDGIVFAGYGPMFATIFAFFLTGTMAESILGEREAGSLRRLLAAPVHRGTIIASKMLAYIVVVFLQMLLLFGVGKLLCEMPLGNSPLGLIALTLALALAATGLGMLIGSLARTQKQAAAIGMILSFVLFFSSGAPSATITRTGVEPGLEGLRFYLSQLTPHVYAYAGYSKLMFQGASVVDILPNILILFGFGVAFFLIGLWRFRYE